MAKNFAPDIPGHFKADDPRWNEIEALQKQFTSGGGRRMRDAPDGPPARQITPGSLFGLRGRGGEFGLGDLQDRKALADYTGTVTGREVGWGPGGDLLSNVNELAAEWGMTGFGSLEEVSEEFIVRLEEMVGIR